jgi:hypothetical protein
MGNIIDQIAEQGKGRLDAVYDELVEGAAEAHQALLPCAAVDDELADQAVVVGRNAIALIGTGIDPDTKAAGRMETRDRAGRGRKGARVLGVDPAFDGVAGEADLVLGERQPLTGGDEDLLVDEVDVGDRLGHRMLDLEAGVHLDEVELAVLVQEFDGAGAGITEIGHCLGDDAAHALALFCVDRGRGRLLPDLLVAPLQRTVAFAEVNRGTLAVAHDLEFDMARLGEVFLDIDGVVAEGGAGLGAGVGQGVGKVVGRARYLHAAAAAAGGSLDEDREADLAGDAAGGGVVGDRPIGAGNDRDAEAHGRAFGLDLVAHQADMLGARTDEGDAVGGEDVGETRVLRQEAVARMNGVCAGDLASGEDLRDVQIGFAGRRWADADALVGKADMHRVGVGRRVDGDGGDAELLAGAEDTKRDLSAVGDQDLREHGRRRVHSMIISGSPYSTGWPSSTMMLSTVPARGAGIWFIVFIASTMRSVCPSRTLSPTST